MEVKEKYTNLVERAEKVALREGQGLRMLHDDFAPGWERYEEYVEEVVLDDGTTELQTLSRPAEPRGVLTFTDKPAPISPVINWKAKFQAASSADKIKVIAQFLGLEEVN